MSLVCADDLTRAQDEPNFLNYKNITLQLSDTYRTRYFILFILNFFFAPVIFFFFISKNNKILFGTITLCRLCSFLNKTTT